MERLGFRKCVIWIGCAWLAAVANMGLALELPDYASDAEPGLTIVSPQENETPQLKLKINQEDSRSRKHEKRDKQEHAGKRRKQGSHAGPHQSGPYEITGVRIVDIHSGKVMPIDVVDLKPTFDRIAAGIKNPHRNDGTVFRNFSHKLPRKSRNYYREYVVPTKGIRGPGPQRLIIGEDGEAYYTYDHYDSFIKVERE